MSLYLVAAPSSPNSALVAALQDILAIDLDGPSTQEALLTVARGAAAIPLPGITQDGVTLLQHLQCTVMEDPFRLQLVKADVSSHASLALWLLGHSIMNSLQDAVGAVIDVLNGKSLTILWTTEAANVSQYKKEIMDLGGVTDVYKYGEPPPTPLINAMRDARKSLAMLYQLLPESLVEQMTLELGLFAESQGIESQTRPKC